MQTAAAHDPAAAFGTAGPAHQDVEEPVRWHPEMVAASLGPAVGMGRQHTMVG